MAWWRGHPGFSQRFTGTFVLGRSYARDFMAFSHDERGVGRVFQMIFGAGQWTLTREDPDMHQRFIATVGRDRIISRSEGRRTWARPGERTST